MGDYTQRVSQNDRWQPPPARLHNETIAAVTSFRAQERPQRSAPLNGRIPEGLILVQNTSHDDVDRFGVLGIDDIVISSDDNLAEFQNNAALKCVTPKASDHTGKFVITSEPIPKGQVGKAFIFGTCCVQIDMQADGDSYADVTDDDSTKLTSGSDGAAQILWVTEGTGLQWAYVRLGNPSPFSRWQIIGKGPSPGFYYARRLFGTPRYRTGVLADPQTVPDIPADTDEYVNNPTAQIPDVNPADIAEALVHNVFEANDQIGLATPVGVTATAGWGLPFNTLGWIAVKSVFGGNSIRIGGIVVDARYSGSKDANTGLPVYRCNVVPPARRMTIAFDPGDSTGIYSLCSGGTGGGTIINQGEQYAVSSVAKFHSLSYQTKVLAEYSGWWDTTYNQAIYNISIDPEIFEVKLVNTNYGSPAQGSGSSPASFVYTATYTTRTNGGNVTCIVGTSLTPQQQRPNGLTKPAKIGMGRFGSAGISGNNGGVGNFTLLWCDECPG